MCTNRRGTGFLEDKGDVEDRSCHALIPKAREKPRMGNLYATYRHRLICIDVGIMLRLCAGIRYSRGVPA